MGRTPSNHTRSTPQRLPQRAQGWRQRRTIDEIEETGRFYIDPAIIPEGMDYEWKRMSMFGMEDDKNMIHVQRDGAWDPVPASRHPELLGKYYDAEAKDQAVILDGMILMERPMAYSMAAREENNRVAKGRVSNQFKSLGLDQGNGPPKMRPQVKISHDSVQVVPEDDVAEAGA